MAKHLVFHGKQQVELESFEAAHPGEGQVAVRALYSLMSTGTENVVFNRHFDEGTHWDNWVRYPFYPGYALVGEIAQVGPGVDGARLGQRVALRTAHSSWAVEPASQCYPIPNAIEARDATWFALAKIAFMGVLAAAYRIGDSVLVLGAGPIGQMSLRWAVAAGCSPVLVADPAAARMEFARRGGATACFDLPADGCSEAISKAGGGALPSVVIDSTGHPAVFSAALALAADGGRVVILGDTGAPASQHLTGDLIIKGLTVTGAYDARNDATWNNESIARLFFDLVARERISLSGLITHTFDPHKCKSAYEAANTSRADTMGILFDWT